jgi:hypothetical protein
MKLGIRLPVGLATPFDECREGLVRFDGLGGIGFDVFGLHDGSKDSRAGFPPPAIRAEPRPIPPLVREGVFVRGRLALDCMQRVQP